MASRNESSARQVQSLLFIFVLLATCCPANANDVVFGGILAASDGLAGGDRGREPSPQNGTDVPPSPVNAIAATPPAWKSEEIVSAASPPPLRASVSSVLPTEDVARQILLKEIELERLNEHFRLESTRQGYWRPWRQFVYGEANSIPTEGGLTAAMVIQWQKIHYPVKYEFEKETVHNDRTFISFTEKTAKVRKTPEADGEQVQEPQLVGNLIGCTGDVIELGINAFREMKLRKYGYDGSTYRKRVQHIVSELDTLIDRRNAIIANLKDASATEIETMKLEGHVLYDMRDLAILNYSEYHASARKLKFFQNAAYLVDLAKNASGAAGNIVQIEGDHINHARYVGFGGLANVLSGTFIILTPIFGRITGNTAGLVDRRIVNSDFKHGQISSAAALQVDRKLLESKLANNTAGTFDSIAQRTSIYKLQEDILLARAKLTAREEKQAKRTTIENLTYGGIVGTSKVGLGVCNILAGWRYYNRAPIAARLSAAGNTSYATGTAFGIVETARVRYSQERHLHQDKAAGLTPAQVTHANLAKLDLMEQQIH